MIHEFASLTYPVHVQSLNPEWTLEFQVPSTLLPFSPVILTILHWFSLVLHHTLLYILHYPFCSLLYYHNDI